MDGGRQRGSSIRARLALMLALFAIVPSLLVTFLASQRIARSLELMKSPGVTRTLDSAFEVSKASLATLEESLHAAAVAAAAGPEARSFLGAGAAPEAEAALPPLLERHPVDYACLYTKSGGGGWRIAAEVTGPAAAGGAEVPAAEGPSTEGAGEESATHADSPAESPAGRHPEAAEDPPPAAVPRPELPRPLGPGLYYDKAGWLVDAVEVPRPASAGGRRGTAAEPGAGSAAEGAAGTALDAATADDGESAPGSEREPGAAGAAEGAGTEALMVMALYLGPGFFDHVSHVGRGIAFYRQLDILKGLYVGTIWIWAAALLLVLTVASLLTARWAARSLSRPLVRLADGMSKVARGDEGVVVEPSGSRETRFLAERFNSMVDELAAYKRDLAMAERAAAWQDIARVAAHEIRNPLTPIQFAIRRIRDRVKSMPEDEQKALSEGLDSILGEVDTLKSLASSFSQFAKLPEPSPARRNLNTPASEAVELFRHEKSADFALELDEDLPDAHLDSGQIRMVLNNLLKNSVEAMPDGGRVTVRTRSERGGGRSWVVLEVEDTGPGMDRETLARATDAYFTTKAKGSGLGLAVVHKIVLQHGGRLEIESSPGAGAKITLMFPAAGGEA